MHVSSTVLAMVISCGNEVAHSAFQMFYNQPNTACPSVTGTKTTKPTRSALHQHTVPFPSFSFALDVLASKSLTTYFF